MDSGFAQADLNADGTYHIDFANFTTDGTAQGTAYSPAPMNKLFDVTCTAIQNGPLIKLNSSDGATVQDKDGNYYKPRPEGNTSQGYTATVSNIKPETYYLTFFTNKSSGSSNVYHYQIYSLERFEKHSESDNWKPNKIIRSYNDPVHLFIGNLYEYIGEQGQKFTIDVTPRVPS